MRMLDSFILDISIAPLQVHCYSEALPTTNSTDTVSEFHAEAPQATASEGLAQGPYVARFEPAVLRTTDIESTNEPPHPTIMSICHLDVRLTRSLMSSI